MDCSTPGFPVLHHLPELVPVPGIEPTYPAVEMWSLSRWTSWEVPEQSHLERRSWADHAEFSCPPSQCSSCQLGTLMLSAGHNQWSNIHSGFRVWWETIDPGCDDLATTPNEQESGDLFRSSCPGTDGLGCCCHWPLWAGEALHWGTWFLVRANFQQSYPRWNLQMDWQLRELQPQIACTYSHCFVELDAFPSQSAPGEDWVTFIEELYQVSLWIWHCHLIQQVTSEEGNSIR